MIEVLIAIRLNCIMDVCSGVTYFKWGVDGVGVGRGGL